MEVHLEGPLRPTKRVIGSYRKLAGSWGSWDYRQQRIVANSPLPILDCLVTIERLLRRADREAEGARLLSEYAPKGHLGFESPALRQFNFKEGSRVGPFFSLKNVSWGFEPQKRRRPFGHLLSVSVSFLWPLYLGRFGHGFAFGRERAVVDAAA